MSNIILKLANQTNCTGCLACVDSCTRGALKMSISLDGHIYPLLTSGCIQCGACERVCPINKPYYSENSTQKGRSEPYAAWNTSVEQIKHSASGGVFAAVATYILQQGGSVAGAISDGAEVRHILIDKLQDLPLMQGSKYLQSNTTGIYQAVRNRLKNEKPLLFSGTGCQIAGLLSFLGSKHYTNLITMDLICAGVPSRLIMQRFCEEENIKPEHIQWRDKENGWRHGLQLTIIANGKKKIWKAENCFLCGGFSNGLTNRESCYSCKFSGAHRMSDFTVGDYWGCKKFTQQHFNGISVMIIHSAKARELIKSIPNFEYHSEKWEDVAIKNPRLLIGKKPLRILMFERTIMPYAFKHFSYNFLKKMYVFIPNSEWWYLPYKFLRYSRRIIGSQILNRQVKKALKDL